LLVWFDVDKANAGLCRPLFLLLAMDKVSTALTAGYTCLILINTATLYMGK
jgi:hypothetical protein